MLVQRQRDSRAALPEVQILTLRPTSFVANPVAEYAPDVGLPRTRGGPRAAGFQRKAWHLAIDVGAVAEDRQAHRDRPDDPLHIVEAAPTIFFFSNQLPPVEPVLNITLNFALHTCVV
jgi:hypothetical protein